MSSSAAERTRATGGWGACAAPSNGDGSRRRLTTASDVAFVEPDRPTYNPRIEPVRAALTAEQFAEHDSPTAPAMASDGAAAGWQDETCERKALPPDVRADTVDDAISEQVGPDPWSERVARAGGDRVDLLPALRASEDRM